MRRSIFIFFIFLLSIDFVFGQDKPKAVLIDEFGALQCEEIIARQDQLYIVIQDQPGSKGYVIIHPETGNNTYARTIESYLYGQHSARRKDDKVFQIVHGEEVKDGPLVRFWKVPAGADLPEFKTARWNFSLSKDQKPFKFNDSDLDLGPCPIGPQYSRYSAYLNANPHIAGNIVIKAKNKKMFEETKSVIFKDLTDQFGVSPKQLRFFYVNERAYSYSRIEYWLVPGRIKN